MVLAPSLEGPRFLCFEIAWIESIQCSSYVAYTGLCVYCQLFLILIGVFET